MTLFDVIAGLILLVSAFIGFVRGATRELMTVLAFIVAAALSILLLRFTGPLARSAIDPDWAGLGVAILIVFVIFYIALRVLGARLVERVHGIDSLGTLDRVVGVGVGILRALVVLGAFNLVFLAATPEEREPSWVTGAALYPLTEAAGKVLKALAPEGKAVAGKIGPAIEKAVRDSAGDTETPEGEGYNSGERSSQGGLVEKSRRARHGASPTTSGPGSNAADSASSALLRRRRSRRWASMPCSTGVRKPAASPASMASASTPSTTWAWWATPSPARTWWTACRAPPPSATPAIPPPAAASSATSSRCSPTSPRAAWPWPTTAT